MNTKHYERGIYENPMKPTIKVEGTGLKGWGENTTVIWFTNLPSYGKGRFGMEGEHLERFMDGYTLRKEA